MIEVYSTIKIPVKSITFIVCNVPLQNAAENFLRLGLEVLSIMNFS